MVVCVYMPKHCWFDLIAESFFLGLCFSYLCSLLCFINCMFSGTLYSEYTNMMYVMRVSEFVDGL